MSSYPNDISVSRLDAGQAFDGLSANEKLYALHIATASWEGAKICLFQCSYEAPVIFTLLQLTFSGEKDDGFERLKAAAGVGEEEWRAFLTFAAAFLANMGNMKSFGDSKIIPAISAEAFHRILTAATAYSSHKALIEELWEAVREVLYSTAPVKELGFPPSGSSSYYSANVSKDDATAVQTFLDERGISAYNTRLFKEVEGGYLVRQAAAEASPSPVAEGTVGGDGGGQAPIKVVAGDFAPLMGRVAAALERAKAHAASPLQERMLTHYCQSFRTGSIEAHKDGSRVWVQDKGPAVESYIGFIESYRDPFGVRAEWEGFVAVVNRSMSEKFADLVQAAESLLPLLPWPPSFEKDAFLRPDFTSLDVLAFGSSGIPAGINIPNYDDIRQDEGFKNVSLGNVLAASLSTKTVNFLRSDNGDEALFKALVKEAFEVQVGIHELLGHGSGKLFCQHKDGSFNFERESTLDPLTDRPVASFYKPGESWDSRFPGFGSSYEECRAELVGIFLCVQTRVLSIFGHEGDKAQDILYVNWLNMARAGLLALEFYRPETGSWGQAHMQARFCILRVLLEAGKGLVTLAPDEEKGLTVSLDRTKILEVGVPAVADFLRRIQVYKSTADVEQARSMYVDTYSQVPAHLLALRQVVLAKKKERPLFVQPHLELPPGEAVGEPEVRLREFPATVEGVIQSFQARFPALDEDMLRLWRADRDVVAPLYLREGIDGSGAGPKRYKVQNGDGGAAVATA
ncbi:hypothetical protein NSK_006553 [Nannochloropsis salina CCMP1776]|uniref:Dipeptidyl peptidase 3 n=1 Tax=Nannochloropsis salina CCMP1776 TaxID=1027361 RepID=A0A4D9CUF4_9STRA|nr:hypothetical protein NSK_006553 [Nannochloropsis salina CCMP1776]|eukprot:TFJ82224.1 hypothetical protein NSK_006553 [Nannochloropsis salina CCMP1776]